MLADAGGYEILRTGERGNRQLVLLSIPPGGYTVAYLKATIATAKGYIRPLQKDLVFNSTATAEQVQMQISISPKVSCVNCNSQVPMDLMRKHEETCAGGSSGTLTISSSENEAITDKNVQEEDLTQLQSMFPNFDKETVRQALDSASGSLSRAAEALLVSSGDLIDNDSSSDLELLESAFDPAPDSYTTPVHTLNDVMVDHKRKLKLAGSERISIDRIKLWEESVAVFKNPRFNVSAAPRVTFAGEAGVDGGGLSKEFGSLLRREIFSPGANLFEGQEKRKMPIFSVQGMQSRLFQLVGKVVAYLIIHLDIGIPVLSPPVYHYIAYRSLEGAASLCTLEDICDFELRELILKVNSATSNDDLEAVKREGVLMDGLINAGWLQDLSLENKDLAIQTLMVHFILEKRKEPLDQFCKGLKTLGILELVRSHPELMKRYFVVIEEAPFKSEDVIGLLSLPDPTAEPLDDKSSRAHGYLLQGITKLEKDQGSDGLHKLLQYMTALSRIPPLGLERKIEVEFDDYASSFFAETCGFVLRVPTIHETFDSFMVKLLEAVENNTGFASV